MRVTHTRIIDGSLYVRDYIMYTEVPYFNTHLSIRRFDVPIFY